MAADDSTRYGDLCRLCATKTNMILGINIFENEGAIRQINKKIETCLPIQVHAADELPKMICENCIYKLELFYDFRERSLRTENLLIELFKELSATKAHNTLNKISHQLNINALNHTDIILVQNNDLLNQQTLQDIDLSQLDHRHAIMMDNEIMLNQHNSNLSTHPLNSIDLNNHDLTGHEISNHSLNGQEQIIVNTSNDLQLLHHPRYMDDSLNLIHSDQQFIAEQFILQQETHSQTPINSHSINDVHNQQLHPNVNNTAQVQEDIFEEHKINFNELTSHRIVTTTDTMQTSLPHKENVLTSHNKNSIDHNNMVSVPQQLKDYNSAPTMVPKLEEFSNMSKVNCNLNFVMEKPLQEHVNCKEKPPEKSTKTKLKSPGTSPAKRDLKTVTGPARSDSEDADDIKDEDSLEVDEASSLREDTTTVPSTTTPKIKKWLPKECKECGKTYKTNYKLMEHMRKHTGEKPYKCGSCEKAFRSKIGLAQHEAKHTGQYDLSCSICGKGFQCKSYLMVHQKVHSDLKPYPCTTCGRQFKTKQSLLDHTNRHLGVKPYNCEVCGKGFITKGLCRAHQRTHWGMDNRKFLCPVCKKMFVSKSYLQTHLRIHTGEKPFKCQFCNKAFLTRVDLRIHSTMHTGEKSYVCEICGKAFARRDALRCHRRSHTGERPYSCEVCGQTFTQFSPMAIHKRLHTGERPYPCDVCGKSFVSRSTMMCHYKKHSKD